MRKNCLIGRLLPVSLAGRITLAQASLANIPGYVMQSSAIPAIVCDEAERMCMNFIWGSTAEHRKCHLISWSKICLSKESCGLGFKDLRTLNKACMMKLAWSLVAELDKLSVKIMKAKYNCGALSMPKVASINTCSSVWKAIVGVWTEAESRVSWSLRYKNAIRFWKD